MHKRTKIVTGALSAVLLLGGVTYGSTKTAKPIEVAQAAPEPTKTEAISALTTAEVVKESINTAYQAPAVSPAEIALAGDIYDPKPTQEHYADYPVETKDLVYRHDLEIWLIRNLDERSKLTEAEVAILEDDSLRFKDTATYPIPDRSDPNYQPGSGGERAYADTDKRPYPPGYNSLDPGDMKDPKYLADLEAWYQRHPEERPKRAPAK